MTREEAIEILKNSAWLGTDEHREETEKAIRMAISALEQEPCSNAENTLESALKTRCEDAISREAVRQAIDEIYNSSENMEEYADTLDATIEILPSVTPSRRKGRWRKTPKAVMGEGYMWFCDNCEYEVYQDSSRDYPSEKFCPQCGAYMERAVANGIPFENVIEDIKAEIYKTIDDNDSVYYTSALHKALEIIDKHIK